MARAEKLRIRRPEAAAQPVDCRSIPPMTDKTGAIRTREAETQTTWRCLTCRWELVDKILPRKCPRCGASRVKFVELGAQAENE